MAVVEDRLGIDCTGGQGHGGRPMWGRTVASPADRLVINIYLGPIIFGCVIGFLIYSI